MPMIQGIDGNVLLNALRAGREDRFNDEKRALEVAKAKREEEKAGQFQRLAQTAMSQYLGGQQPSGVQGNFAPSNPQPETFEQAFAPAEMARIERGERAPAAATMQAPPRQQRQLDMNILSQMMMLDPETTGKIVTSLKAMDEMTLKRMEAKNTSMGATAAWLAGKPEGERRQWLQVLAPQMIAAGWTEEELAQADLRDGALVGYQNQAMAMDDIIDNALAEREFMAGKNVPVTAGGNVVNIKPDGTARYVVGGGDAVASSSGVTTKTIGGKTYYNVGGKWFDEPPAEGGGVGDGTGGFRLVKNARSVIEKVLPGVRVTDHIRSRDSALGRKNPKSFHVRSGAAVDIAPIPGMTFSQAVDRLRAAGYNVHPDSRDEVANPSGHATGPHWHFVIGEAA